MAGTRTDGDGWTSCALGHRHWGLHGAAGLLLRTLERDGTVRVLLQHRAVWSHDGDTWGLPGGARRGAETTEQAALREAVEETGLDLAAVRVRGQHRDDHGGWAYDTVVADTPGVLPLTPDAESQELRWVAEDEVAGRALHPGFAATWPLLRATPVTLVVDGANVVGSRPDGWWRDRAGAARRLRGRLEGLRGTTCRLPDAGWALVRDVVLVVEGAARGAADGPPGWVRVVPAEGSGDDAVVTAARRTGGGAARTSGSAELAVRSTRTVVVTADRGLRTRVAPLATVGPRWLLDLLDTAPGTRRGSDGPEPVLSPHQPGEG